MSVPNSTTSPAQATAQALHDRGFALVKLQGKEPGAGWLTARPTAADFDPGDNLGINDGRPSGHFYDADLDHPLAVALAPYFLPSTPMVWGKPSTGRSHYGYRGDVDYRHIDYKDVAPGVEEVDKLVAEFRGTGHCTMVPPSVHPDTGETLVWFGPDGMGEPARVDPSALHAALSRLLAAVSLARLWPKLDGTRHATSLALAGALARSEVDPDEIETFVRAVATAAGDDDLEDRARAALDTVAKWHAGDERVTGRAAVSVADGNINRIGGKAIKALHEANDPPILYIGPKGAIVRIGLDKEDRAAIKPVDEHALRFHAVEAVKFTKPAKPTGANPDPHPVETLVSLDVIRNLAARRELPFPPLAQIVRAPIFGGAGAQWLQTATGYAAGAAAYVDLGDFRLDREPSPSPSRDEIAEAVGLVDELLTDFPFADAADKANAIAYGALPYYRNQIKGPTPLHVFESSGPGSGKGRLLDTFSHIATGRGAPALSQPKDDDEYRKTITSKALAGAAYFTIGNATRPIDSGALAEALTTERWEDRLLGGNTSAEMPMRFIWALTANNPTVSHEIARRSVRIRLAPDTDRPWLRTGFRHELPTWAIENRPRLVGAFCTLWSAWFAAGCPRGAATMGSFEEWAATMGGVLSVAGVEGFLGNVEAFYEAADVAGQAWRSLVALWWDVFGSTDVTSAELKPLTDGIEGIAFKSEKERGIQTEWASMLRGQKDNHFALGDDAGSVRLDKREKPDRKGMAVYRLVHRDGTARPRTEADAEKVKRGPWGEARNPWAEQANPFDLSGVGR